MPNGSKWRMPQQCADCPFASSGPGLRLRKSLAPGRFSEIKRGLLRGDTFYCHKTTDQTGNGTNLVCAGALEYQDANSASSQFARICERLDWIASERAKR